VLRKASPEKTYKWDSKCCGDVSKEDESLGEHCKDFRKLRNGGFARNVVAAKAKCGLRRRWYSNKKILHV